MWSTLEISGKEVELFTPSQNSGTGAIIYLHAHGEERLSEKEDFTQLFEKYGLPVICPRGKRSWWLDVICQEFDSHVTPAEFIKTDLVNWIKEQLKIEPPKIALFGISMGGQGALNLSYRNARMFPVVAAVSPAIDFHIAYGKKLPLDDMFQNAEAARQQTATLHIHPLNWPKYQFFACDPQDPTWFDGCERLSSKLSSSGLFCEQDLETSLGGHNWVYFTAMSDKALQFISHSLAQF